jgi:hypothetical protein
LNKALKWIDIQSKKKRLVTKIAFCIHISKFDMKLGFWQIQIHPKEHYKTAFTISYGHYG